jgi:hypothetical protein
MIYENNELLAEAARFSADEQMILADAKNDCGICCARSAMNSTTSSSTVRPRLAS